MKLPNNYEKKASRLALEIINISRGDFYSLLGIPLRLPIHEVSEAWRGRRFRSLKVTTASEIPGFLRSVQS